MGATSTQNENHVSSFPFLKKILLMVACGRRQWSKWKEMNEVKLVIYISFVANNLQAYLEIQLTSSKQ